MRDLEDQCGAAAQQQHALAIDSPNDCARAEQADIAHRAPIVPLTGASAGWSQAR
jgi:hypothetical protein